MLLVVTAPEVAALIDAVDEHPTPGSYATAARALRDHGDALDPCSVALVASFTIDPLVPVLTVEAARAGFAVTPSVAPFDSIHQQLRDPTSECVRSEPDVVFVAQLLETAAPPLWNSFVALSPTEIAEFGEMVVAELVASVRRFRELSPADVVVHDFVLPSAPAFGIAEPMANPSQADVVRDLNRRLADALADIPGAGVLGFDRVCADVGYTRWRDDRMWDAALSPLTAEAARALARAQARYLRALRGRPAKCLVVDLDGTLWGGVVGEVGVGGIELGEAYPGRSYLRFQRALLALRDRGVLLAINSKNNSADVDDVFATHPDMLVRPEHFAATRVNWRPKPENMVAIAEELSIGLDSLVFFDDNPAERLAMRQALPEVTTIEVPADPSQHASVILGCGLFDRLVVTDEDRNRADMYRQQAARKDLERSAGSLEGYLASLEMKAEIGPVDELSFRRVLDLFGKTNQFNVTTPRYNAQELQALVDDESAAVFTVRVTDRFGDNGIVGVLILRVADRAVIDTLLLSCRVIGRTVETALLAVAVEWAAQRSLHDLDATFIATKKNGPAADVFARHGFQEIGTADADGASHWRLVLEDSKLSWPAEIERIPAEGVEEEGTG